MSSYKPLKDATAIAHLDWVLLCEVHMVGFPPPRNGQLGPQYEIEPPCGEKATLTVTYHTVTTCRVIQQFMCSRHFNALFMNLPDTHKDCPVCGARRFISAKPLFP